MTTRHGSCRCDSHSNYHAVGLNPTHFSVFPSVVAILAQVGLNPTHFSVFPFVGGVHGVAAVVHARWYSGGEYPLPGPR